MSTEKEIIEEILKIHDSEFHESSLFFQQAYYYINLGKWYWPKYFNAVLGPLYDWHFDISGNTLPNDKLLVEKFDRIWASKCIKIDQLREKRKEKELQSILTILKSKRSTNG